MNSFNFSVVSSSSVSYYSKILSAQTVITSLQNTVKELYWHPYKMDDHQDLLRRMCNLVKYFFQDLQVTCSVTKINNKLYEVLISNHSASTKIQVAMLIIDDLADEMKELIKLHSFQFP